MDEHVHFPPIYGRSIKLRNSEERQLMKWVGIFQVGLFLGGNNPGAGGGIFLGEIFLEPKKKNKETTFANTALSCFYDFIVKKKYGFIGKGSPSENVIAEEELVYIDVDDIGNLGD